MTATFTLVIFWRCQILYYPGFLEQLGWQNQAVAQFPHFKLPIEKKIINWGIFKLLTSMVLEDERKGIKKMQEATKYTDFISDTYELTFQKAIVYNDLGD